MNLVVVEKNTNRLLASISDENVIISDDVEVINYGNNSPIFVEDVNGNVYVKNNAFEIDLKDKGDKK